MYTHINTFVYLSILNQFMIITLDGVWLNVKFSKHKRMSLDVPFDTFYKQPITEVLMHATGLRGQTSKLRLLERNSFKSIGKLTNLKKKNANRAWCD